MEYGRQRLNVATMNKTACLTSVPRRRRVWNGPPLCCHPFFFNNTIIRLYIILYGHIIEWHVRFRCYFSFIKCPQPTTIINWKAYYTFFLLCQKSYFCRLACFFHLAHSYIYVRSISFLCTDNRIIYYLLLFNNSLEYGTYTFRYVVYMYLICQSTSIFNL